MHVAIVGSGFGGMSAAYEIAKAGCKVTVLERSDRLGGLAATFNAGGQDIEKFYHHWLGTDTDVFEFIEEIGCLEKLNFRPSKVGIYYASKVYRFSSPLDLLKFNPLSFIARLRFGFSILYSWILRDTKSLENISAVDWLLKVAGRESFETIWRPLLVGKFGEAYYREVAAIWIWNKLIQRGKSRDRSAKEFLGYYKHGFSGFIEDLSDKIREMGGEIISDSDVSLVRSAARSKIELCINGAWSTYDKVIYTGHTPELAEIWDQSGYIEEAKQLKKIKYLANICLILETTQSLSDTYWLNVNDVSFPFVGIIEHTNFENKENYSGKHLIYLSKYLPASDPLYALSEDEMTKFAIPHIKRLFPKFDEAWISRSFLWKAEFAQPLITKNYADIIPRVSTHIPNFFLSTMAQVYPEDRGTNYAVKHGREIGKFLVEQAEGEVIQNERR